MALVASPYGLRPVNLIGGQNFNGGVSRAIPMTTNSATAIGVGSLITINAGQPSAATATPTTTRSANTPLGVCTGVSYTLPGQGGQPQWAQFLPANAVNAGYTNIVILVNDDPDQVFQCQANGPITQASIGLNVALENFGASATTGLSTIRLNNTPASTATLAMRIVDLPNQPGSTPGDAFTDCYVKFNIGVHAYTNSTGG